LSTSTRIDELRPRVCMSIHREGRSCFDLGSVLVLNGPPTGLCTGCPIIESQTRYWVYLVADDDAGNMQASPRRLAVETTDITPPALEAGTASRQADAVDAFERERERYASACEYEGIRLSPWFPF